MDMKAPVSLSNAPAPKAEAPARTSANSQSESSDFDRQLSRQMERAEPKKTAAETDKAEKNQQLSDKAEVQESVDGEAESSATEGFRIVDEYFLEAGDGDQTIELAEAEEGSLVATELVEEGGSPLLMEQEKEQIMPLAGNDLPRKIQSENIINKDQPVKINLEETPEQLPQKTSRTLNKQPALAEVLSEEIIEKRPEVEYKPELKIQRTNDNQQTRPGINIATLAAAASLQQNVPQVTASAAINMQPVTAAEGFTSTLASSSGIAAAVQSPNWSQGLTEKVSWMMQGNIQTAELKLNPAHLGPLEVKLSIQDDRASVAFVTGHAQVKEAIDVAMPRLREMLEQQGLDLVDVDVSQYSDTKDEQADGAGQGTDGDGSGSADADQQTALLHESVINVNVDQGLSIFV